MDAVYLRVKAAIDRADLMDLFPDAPNDEYEPEIRRIYHKAQQCQDTEELAKTIKSVFSESFAGCIFLFDMEKCQKIAQGIREP